MKTFMKLQDDIKLDAGLVSAVGRASWLAFGSSGSIPGSSTFFS